MKGERTKEDREHIDDQPTKNKELKELMPDDARAVDKSDKKTTAASDKVGEDDRFAGSRRKRVPGKRK